MGSLSNLYLLKFEYYIMCGKLDSVKEIMEKYKNKSNTNKDILSAMTLLIEKIKGDSDNIKEYKMLLSNKLFKIDQLHSDDYCKCNICNCQKIKKAYDKFLIALPKGVQKSKISKVFEGCASMLELKTKIAVRTVNRFLRDNTDNFDSVEWVLFDSYTESTNE